MIEKTIDHLNKFLDIIGEKLCYMETLPEDFTPEQLAKYELLERIYFSKGQQLDRLMGM